MEEQKRGYMERLEALEVGQKRIEKKLNDVLMAQSVILNELASGIVEAMEVASTPKEKLSLMLGLSALSDTRDRCADVATDGKFSDEEKDDKAKRLYSELLKFFS